jgi:16S rRNA (cytosine1402-N4)-methyltransferase
MQLETAGRGFSFFRKGYLDMRFDVTQGRTAFQLVNSMDEKQLADIIYQLGEEPRARGIAREIVRERPIETTVDLAAVVSRAVGRSRKSAIHPATRTFQALRMAVNRELENLREGLEQALGVLGPGGRLVAISYHSLEDRQVKSILRREGSRCICPPGLPECVCGHRPTVRLVNRRVIRPSPDEVRSNPRSRSARMRVAERV